MSFNKGYLQKSESEVNIEGQKESRIVLRDRSQPPAPNGVVCYICGREYRGGRMDMHIKACKRRHEASQEKKPEGERQPLPQEPANFNSGSAFAITNYSPKKLEDRKNANNSDISKVYESNTSKI